MLLFLPENLYRKNKKLVDKYQEKAKNLIANENLYKNLVSYVSDGINSEKYQEMQAILIELYNELMKNCVDQDKLELYICFNEEMAKTQLKNCTTNESKLYCLYVIITNSNGNADKYIQEFESIYKTLTDKERDMLSERVILAHYLNLMKTNWSVFKTYDEVYDYLVDLMNGVPEKFKTEYFYKILKHHVIQYLPGLMSSAIENSYVTKMSDKQGTIDDFKSFVNKTLDLLKYEDCEYSFHYLNLSVLFDSVLMDLNNHTENFGLVDDYTSRFIVDQRKAFFESKSHNYDPKDLIDFVDENKTLLSGLYKAVYDENCL